jgi:hypothetical protein
MLELHVPFFVGAKFWSWTCPKEMHIAQTYVGTENCIRLFPLYWDLDPGFIFAGPGSNFPWLGYVLTCIGQFM